MALRKEVSQKNCSGDQETDCELEMKRDFVNIVEELKIGYLPDVSRYSRYSRLLHTTARILDSVRKWKSQRKEVTYLREDLERAAILLIHRSQRESFPEEIKLLEANKCVPRSSKLLQLTPKLDNNGLLRINGRIDHSTGVGDDVKNPMILDARNRLVTLILEDYHVKAGHLGLEFTMNEVKQRLYLLKARSAIRKIWRNCILCKIKKTKPNPPMMGELPSCRFQINMRPFTNTGMDYYGPLTVTVGRRQEKRYGVCMTTRAIHLELANSLTADSAIQAIRRMIARRGYPTKIFSDNLTNLRGAHKELKNSLTEIDQDVMTKERALRNIDWSFIPPGSPHMGGSWERLIRSVKVSLTAILKEQHPKEETLSTLLAEVENIVNSRPLTYVSKDSCDEESLTPNNFLIGSSSAMQPPGIFSKDDLCLRKQCRVAQLYADMFWRRWIREYLPTLTKRTKWHVETTPIKISDIVIIADNTLTRNSWPIVTAVYPGKDGRIRVADVKTTSGTYRRPVTKLCILDIKEKDEKP